MRLAMDRLNLNRKHNRGDPCECGKCKGRLNVYCTTTNEDEGIRIQYIACNLCAWKPSDNKLVVPLEFAPVRKRD